MTTTVHFSTIAQSIADIDFSDLGVSVVDIEHIAENTAFTLPLLAPRPDNFLTDIIFTRESFGVSGNEKMTLEYNMHWQYFHAPAGSGLGLFSVYGSMIDNLAGIIEKIMDNDAPSGAIDMQIKEINNIAIFKDPAGNDVLGVDLTLNIKEFVN